MTTALSILPFTPADYDEAYALWKASEGIGLSDADTREAIARYLNRNPGSSFIAREHGKLIGAVLCGSDDRRGYLHHLAVAASHRGQGIGQRLVEHCMQALQRQGITRCHIFVYRNNDVGKGFWKKTGWFERDDLLIMSRNLKY